MTGFEQSASLWGAFIAGLVTGVHCAGMCGLLTCGLGIANRPDYTAALTGYHSGRMVSYTIFGALAGALGYLPVTHFIGKSVYLVPWFLVVFLVLIALRVDRYLPAIPLVSRFFGRLRRRFDGGSAARKGIVMGLASPLLPCGPLYAMLGMGLLSGSPVRGAELMLTFSLGTIPLLWLMQSGASLWQRRVSPAAIQRIQRAVALIAALALAWRFRGVLPFSRAGRAAARWRREWVRDRWSCHRGQTHPRDLLPALRHSVSSPVAPATFTMGSAAPAAASSTDSSTTRACPNSMISKPARPCRR